MTSPAKYQEIEANFDAFQRGLAGWLQSNRDDYALMRHREVVAFYRSAGDAYRAAVKAYPDGIFSIQEVTDEPIDLGFFSHVAH